MTTTIDDEEVLLSVFGEKGTNLIKYLRLLEKDLPAYEYKFMSVEEYKQLSDPAESQKIYWFELLERAHWVSITIIYRTLGWISGIINAYTNNNYLLFSAAYRGFLESSADSFYSLIKVPKAFAVIFAQINSILGGQLSLPVVVYKDLEDFLIHFSYARSIQAIKKNETDTGRKSPPAHTNETVRKYIDSFGDGLRERVHECYSYLCDITHPGMSSVWMYVAKSGDNFKIRNYSDKQYFEKSFIDIFCEQHKSISEEILMLIFNLTMITLKVVNAFNIPELYTPAVSNLSMDHTKLWNEINEYLHVVK